MVSQLQQLRQGELSLCLPAKANDLKEGIGFAEEKQAL